MRRFGIPTVLGTLTVGATVATLVVSHPSLGVLILVAVGAPLTVFSLVLVLADPAGDGRSPWPSLIIGATVVPAIVLLLHGLFLAVGYNLVGPIVEPVDSFGRSCEPIPIYFGC
jgi:hypothetical protein